MQCASLSILHAFLLPRTVYPGLFRLDLPYSTESTDVEKVFWSLRGRQLTPRLDPWLAYVTKKYSPLVILGSPWMGERPMKEL